MILAQLEIGPGFLAHGMSCVVWPESVKVITPAQMQLSVELTSSAGALHNTTVAAPGVQGAGVTGIHGIGVGVPMAAAVAAATMGFDGDWHMPKGGILSIGTLSRILAAMTLLVRTVLGVGFKTLGAMPKLHFILAPIHVCFGMVKPPFTAWRNPNSTGQRNVHILWQMHCQTILQNCLQLRCKVDRRAPETVPTIGLCA
jgi:hypothetical protein